MTPPEKLQLTMINQIIAEKKMKNIKFYSFPSPGFVWIILLFVQLQVMYIVARLV